MNHMNEPITPSPQLTAKALLFWRVALVVFGTIVLVSAQFGAYWLSFGLCIIAYIVLGIRKFRKHTNKSRKDGRVK